MARKDYFFCRVNEVREKRRINGQLVNEEASMPIEQDEEKGILFTKEQFNAGLRFPLPALFKEFLHFSQFPPIFIHPNIVRVLMGCSIINMLYNLDLTLLEVFFLYSLKKGKNDIFSLSAHLPSLQVAKGLVLVRGGWAGISERPSRPFSPNYTLKLPGPELRGFLVDWVEKTSFACVCKLCEIDPKERAYKTLLSARNLMAIVRESQEYVINILPRKLSKEEIVPGEHYTVKELPIYLEAKEADAEKRRKLLEDRDKRKNEGTIRKAPGQKRGPDSPPKKTPAKKKTGPRRIAGLNHSAPPRRGCASANVVRKRIHQPDPSGGSGRKPKSILRRPDRLALTLVKGPPPKKPREVEMATCTSTAPAIIPDEDAVGKTRPVKDVAVLNPGQEAHASSSEEELDDDKLKQITPDWKAIKPSAKMFDMMEALMRGLRSLAQQHNLFTQLLQTADYMKTFASRRQEIENQLRLSLEKAEASLSTLREENEALRVELAEAKSREESTAGRLYEAEGEAARLRDEVNQLRMEVSNEKKQKEDLQLPSTHLLK
ncbi:hypothetical protein AAG906_036942 [Vitis piasezkii]